MPKVNEILLKLEVFRYAMLLDLNMEYYHIQLTEDASNLCKSLYLGKSTVTNVYKWEFLTYQKFSNRK